MHDLPLLEILAMGFALALVFGYITHRLGFSPIVGYLLAGFLVGPFSPGYVADLKLAHELSEAGVILLMFGVGLHFDMKDLLAVKGVAVPGAILQIAGAMASSVLLAMLMGLSFASGLILGLGLAVASTVVLLRVLQDNNVLTTVHGHVAVGWLVVEDIFTVLVLVLLPSLGQALAETGSIQLQPLLVALAGAVGKLAILWIVVLIIGGRVVPWLLAKVARTRSQELFTLTVLVMAFAIAVGAAVFFNASVALGAFLGGMVVGKSNVSHQAGADILPLRDAFAVLFFLSVGMLFDPTFLVENPILVVACLFIVLVIKPLTALIVVTILGYSTRTALTVAMGLAQVGEFSFILAQAAQSRGLVGSEVYSVLIVCALISITLNPGAFRSIPWLEKKMKKFPRFYDFLNARADRKAMRGNELLREGFSHEALEGLLAIVVGYGPTGQSVTSALREKGITPVVIDMNVDTVNSLNEQGIRAVFGDAAKKDVLLAAGVEQAFYLVMTVPEVTSTVDAVTIAHSLNNKLRVLVRARFLNDGGILNTVCVNGIAFEEQEVALALTRLLLEDVERCGEGQCAFDDEDGAEDTEGAAGRNKTCP